MSDPSLTRSGLDNKKTESDTIRVEEPDTHDVADAADGTVAWGESRNPISDFLDFGEYRVHDVIVHRARGTIYQIQFENLVERQDMKFQGFEWVLQLYWTNETKTPSKYTRTVQEGLTIRGGQETEQNFDVSASFKGLGVNAGGYRKEFTNRETSRIETVQKEFTIPARSTIYFYQKRYNFLTEVWFWQYVRNWDKFNHFTVGANQTYARVQRTAVTSIYAEEYATLHRRLNGSTTIDAEEAPRPSGEPTSTREFRNITQRAIDTLARFGIRG